MVALDRVGTVFDEWRRLLKPRPSGLLSMDELRGLVGELWLLLGEFSNARTIGAALEGWLGPMGLPQDFWYPEDGFHEAKSIGPGATRIKISSESQLDADDLELLVLLVGSTDEKATGAVNLPTLVTSRPSRSRRRLGECRAVDRASRSARCGPGRDVLPRHMVRGDADSVIRRRARVSPLSGHPSFPRVCRRSTTRST